MKKGMKKGGRKVSFSEKRDARQRKSQVLLLMEGVYLLMGDARQAWRGTAD